MASPRSVRGVDPVADQRKRPIRGRIYAVRIDVDCTTHHELTMLLSIIGNILGDDDGGSSSSGSDGEGQLAGSISEDELLPGASSGGSGGGGAESDDDIFGDSGGDEEFLDDDSMSLDGMGDAGELDDDGGMSLEGMDAMDGGDDMGGMDAGGDQYSSEIKSRVEEMENEVGSLVSTVNTVQSENEEISESLDDIEENIRKLLEVYEMVTQGVNPFVEDDSLNDGVGPGAGTGNFGGHSLFDTDDDADAAADEDIDEDIASAEAEAFLDESIIDEDDDFEDDFDAGDDLDGGDDLEDDGASEDGGSPDGDVSFDDLKEEFESGDADWDAEEGESDDVEADDGFDDSDAFDDDLDDDIQDDAAGFDDDLDDAFEDDTADELAGDLEAGTADDADAFDDLEAETNTEPDDEEPVDESSLEPDVIAPWDDGGRPYLDTVPSEYDTEFLVMDWLDYLVAEAGIDGTARTIEFYQSVAWISDPVGDYLQTLLNGFNGGPDVDELEARSDLGIDHGRSLWWIEQITTPSKDQPAYAEWLTRKLPTGLEGVRADPEFGSRDESDAESTPIQLEYEELESNAGADEGTAVAADVSTESAMAASDGTQPGGDSADGAVPTATGTADSETETETETEDGAGDDAEPAEESAAGGSQAQKIAIEERDGAADEPDAPGVGTVQSAPTVSTGGVDTDGGRMIWVDPDIVLSESGVELRTTRDDEQPTDQNGRSHHPELVTSLLGAAEDEQLERLREEYVKPLVDRTDDSSLEPWQIDLIQSLLAPDDHAERR